MVLEDSQVLELARAFGTPLYVIGEAHLRDRATRLRDYLEEAHPRSRMAFAAKANSALEVLRVLSEEKCYADVASEGELRAALLAGVPAERCILHGNNKSREELEFAMTSGIGQIVVDNFIELDVIFSLTQQDRPEGGRLRSPDLLLRLAPGVDPKTHEKISTGQADTKFGFDLTNGAASHAVSMAQGLGLPIVGYHCHVGSQLQDVAAQREGARAIAAFARDMTLQRGLWPKVLNVGGGMAVRYTDDEPEIDEREYISAVVGAALDALDGLGEPTVCMELGRSLIAPSGVTIYRVGAMKSIDLPGGRERTYVSVDGGLSDNPRPALYGSRYALRHVPAEGPTTDISREYVVSGKHCETDTLFPDVHLPVDLSTGDYLQVLCTGAYNASMASNYNRLPRPAMVMMGVDGKPRLAQARESWEQMFERELGSRVDA